MSRRRCRGFSRPAATAASTIASITPSPRWRLQARPAGPGPAATRPPAPSRPGGPPPAPSPPDGRTPPARPPTAPAPRRDRPAVNPQVSGPDHDRPRRSPGNRELRRTGLHQQRKADKIAQGTPVTGAGLDTQTPTRSPSPSPKSPQNTRSQLHRSDLTLKYVVLRYGRTRAGHEIRVQHHVGMINIARYVTSVRSGAPTMN